MDWPHLELASWRDTYATLHRCLQIVGKVQLGLTPKTNHFWNVAFRPTARGLATPPLAWKRGRFEVQMDFVDHQVLVRTSGGARRALTFVPRPVADFFRDFMSLLGSLGIEVSIGERPVELQSEIVDFSEDRQHGAYDPEAVERWWHVVAQTAQVLEEFKASFLGKCSPVQFYWGSFDLSVSRYSGRRAPPHPNADPVQREAYSHEVSSVGFWPGDARYPAPAFFAYTPPIPDGLPEAAVSPPQAFWHEGLREFLLPYEAVRDSGSPRQALLDFCRSTYEAGAELAGWDREALERPSGSAAPQAGPGLAETAGHPPPA